MLFVADRRLLEQTSQSQKTILVSILNEDGSIAWELSAIEEWHEDQRTLSCFFHKKITGKKAATLKNLS
jgi:hypothetical protein